jgi:SAM-dependent methyltransferase
MNNEDKKAEIRKSQRMFWEKNWADDNFSPPWKGRGIAPEIVEALEEGWLAEQGRVLDIGCGEGEIAAWFTDRGYTALGLDIAPAVIEAARVKHIKSHNENSLQFTTVDITESAPADLSFNIVIDRGCLHAIHPALIKNYVRNLAAVCSSDARMLLFVKAFRGEVKFKDQQEMTRMHAAVVKIFEDVFEVKSYFATNIGTTAGQTESKWLPGIVFKLERI